MPIIVLVVDGKELNTRFFTALAPAAVLLKNLALNFVPICLLFRLDSIGVLCVPLYEVTKTRLALLPAFLWLDLAALVTQALGL